MMLSKVYRVIKKVLAVVKLCSRNEEMSLVATCMMDAVNTCC